VPDAGRIGHATHQRNECVQSAGARSNHVHEMILAPSGQDETPMRSRLHPRPGGDQACRGVVGRRIERRDASRSRFKSSRPSRAGRPQPRLGG
jgi:hypothetical protein